MSLSVEELRNLSKKIVENPDAVYDLEPEEVMNVRKFINPLGNVISTKKTYVNMSLVNWKERYLRRLHMTSLVGYIYRLAAEYEPEQQIEKEKEAFAKTSAALTGAELAAATAQHNKRLALIKSTAQGIVKQFLNRHFNYNPDHHLMGAHTENSADPERKSKDEAIKRACTVAAAAPQIESKLAARQEDTYKYLRTHLLTTYQSALETTKTLKGVLSVILDPAADLEDKQGILLKKYKELTQITADLAKIAEPIAQAETLPAWEVNPPVDVFHHFDRYLTNHYEQLREVVSALYHEKSDLEYAVILYDSFKTEEAARDYRIQHEGEFRNDVYTIETGAVTLLGPFKENRQRVDFYNKHTEIMKRMMDQFEADHKLGKDLMEKQVKTKKKKNIEEAGPDDPGLAAYSKHMNILSELGVKKVLSPEEIAQMAESKKIIREIKEDYEVPEDAIQVDMFFPQTNSDGTTTLKKAKFYTQAEAPLHLQEGSEYAEKYQPKRDEDEPVSTAYKTKTITDRTGRKVDIKVPVKESE